MSWIDDINAWGSSLNKSIQTSVGVVPTAYPNTGSNFGNSFGTSSTTSTTKATASVGSTTSLPTSSVITPSSTSTMAGGTIKTADGTIYNTVAEKFPYKLTTPMMHGGGIKTVQSLLNQKAGAKLEVHGIFGSATKTALINFQKSKGISADGIYGNCSKYYLEGIGSCSSGSSSSSSSSSSYPSSSSSSSPPAELSQFEQGGSGGGGTPQEKPTIFGIPQDLFWGLGLGVFLVIGFLMMTKYRVFEAKKIVI